MYCKLQINRIHSLRLLYYQMYYIVYFLQHFLCVTKLVVALHCVLRVQARQLL